MPTFNDPSADAAEARQAVRGLAHASQRIDDPDELYGIVGELLGTARSLEQSLIQLSGACLTHQGRAAHDDGDKTLGAADAWAATDALTQAARHISAAETALEQASGHLGRIAWQPAPRRWVSVVFLQGDDADRVVDLIDRDGTDAAVEHLRGFDYGEETTTAALANGHVYDEPPTGATDRQVTAGEYALIHSHAMRSVALYREHPRPGNTEAASRGAAALNRAGAVRGAANTDAAQRALEERRNRVRGDGSWFTPRPHRTDQTRSRTGPMNPRDEEKLHASVLVAPASERRRLRKQRRHAATRLHREQQQRQADEAKARAEAEKAERRARQYLPAAGEPGPAMLRTPGRFRLPRHQDTSATLAGGYPFVAEGGLGSSGVFVGQDLYSGGSFVYDPWVLYARGLITAPNLVLAGIVGSGKSSLMKSLYTRSLAFGRRVYVPGDPKGEHTPVAEAVGGRAIALGHGMTNRLNPLDEGYRPTGLSDTEWQSTVAARRRDLIGALAEVVLARPLTPLEHTSIDTALTATVRENQVPILPMVVERILTPADDADGRLAEDGRIVGHALRRLVAGDLAGLFDGPSTVQFDPTLPMISLDLSRVTENSTLISALMTCCSAWMESALLDPAGGQRWVIYDEAWRLMSQPSLLKRMDAHWRLARHYGIANALIFHKLTDLENVGDSGSAMRSLANSLLANAETRVIYRQESDQLGVTAKTLGLTTTERALLPSFGVGQGLWKIKERSFVVQAQLHPDEMELFDTSARASGLPRKFKNPEA